MTERGQGHVSRSATRLAIGLSSLAWVRSALEIHIDEVTAPVPRRLRGVVRVHPSAVTSSIFDLDANGRHRWWPIAPCARVEVDLNAPSLSWTGQGYLDANDGEEPLEAAFTDWHWSRAPLRSGSAVLYDVARRDGEAASVALRFGPSGDVQEEELPARAPLARSRWRLRRETRADAGHRPSVRHTLEDGPFYARSILSTRLFGESVPAMHESLSLARFRRPWVQAMLPFRMPRALV